MQQVQPPSSATGVLATVNTWKIRETDALAAAEKQAVFFKCVDSFQCDIGDTRAWKQHKPDSLDHAIQKAAACLQKTYIPSRTI
eukprot:9033533-Karenia_brevis.AAC.1